VLSNPKTSRPVAPDARTLAVACLVLAFLPSPSPAACDAPRYRVGHVWEASKSNLMMNISVRMSDFVPEKLVCLAQTLKDRYRDGKELEFLIFSTHTAAIHYTMPLSGDSHSKRTPWAMQLYATYFFHPDKNEEYLYLTSNPAKSFIGSPFDVRIDLPAAAIPPCKFQLNNRCLLAFANIEYPQAAKKAKGNGEITVTATVRRDGKISDAKIAQQQASSLSAEKELADTALENIKSWQFEKTTHSDNIRVTYSYVISTSHEETPGMKLELPNRVVITDAIPTVD
jgi:TonB family protein